MSYSIGGFVGALLAALLLVGLIRWLFGRAGFRNPIVLTAAPPFLFLGVATVAGGYGVARMDEAPVFEEAFTTYLLPAALAAGFYALVDRGRASANS